MHLTWKMNNSLKMLSMIAVVLLGAVVPYVSCSRLGGEFPYNTTLSDPKVVFGVQSINDYYNKLGDQRPRTPIKLLNSTVQIVAGLMYRFNIQVSGGDTPENCKVGVLLTIQRTTISRGDPKCVEAEILLS